MITLIYHVSTFLDLKQMKDFFFFLSESRSGLEWAPTIGGTTTQTILVESLIISKLF